MNTFKFELTGVVPLLMHNNNIEERDRLEEMRKRMKGGKKGDDRSPADSWKTYLYFSESSGNICMPSENLLACLLSGGAKEKFSGKETLKTHSQRVGFDSLDYDLHVNGKPISKADIDQISGEFLEQADAARDLGFRLQVKPCTVGASSHVRVRPMFTNWSISGRFEIHEDDANILNQKSLQALMSTCGRLIGLGDWRPSAPKKPGQYGRFTAVVTKI